MVDATAVVRDWLGYTMRSYAATAITNAGRFCNEWNTRFLVHVLRDHRRIVICPATHRVPALKYSGRHTFRLSLRASPGVSSSYKSAKDAGIIVDR